MLHKKNFIILAIILLVLTISIFLISGNFKKKNPQNETFNEKNIQILDSNPLRQNPLKNKSSIEKYVDSRDEFLDSYLDMQQEIESKIKELEEAYKILEEQQKHLDQKSDNAKKIAEKLENLSQELEQTENQKRELTKEKEFPTIYFLILILNISAISLFFLKNTNIPPYKKLKKSFKFFKKGKYLDLTC